MAIEIVTIGCLLAEVMRKELDKPFDTAADLTGPYPSGDAAIFIDTAARLGGKCGMIGAVGNDGFGKCITDRFERDGVDTSHVFVKEDATTGVAFVAYFGDGSRNFIYHWRHAAAGMLSPEDIDKAWLGSVKWAHVSGCNIAVNESCKQAIYRLLDCLPKEARVSFDPNIRPELLSVDEIRKLCAPAFDRCDVFFPSISEAAMFTGIEDDKACEALAGRGKLVVQKRGEEGCRIYSGGDIIKVPTFSVTEIDPTGAGDSFCAGFITALMEDMPLYEAGLFANATGALSVTKKGPMEGAPTKEEVWKLIKEQRK